MNVALVGSNFALKGYLPVIKKIRQLKLKILCNRKISKSKQILSKLSGPIHEKNWKNIFINDIDLIILAVPPEVQNQILNYNLKFKKKFDYKPNHLSLLSYDLIGLIYYLSLKNDSKEIYKSFQTKNIFKGKIGIFEIKDNKINHELNFYEVNNGKLKEIF